MKRMSRFVSTVCMFSLLPITIFAMEPSNYIGYYSDMDRNYITFSPPAPYQSIEIYAWMYAGWNGMACAEFKATINPPGCIMIGETEYNPDIISYSGSLFGSPGIEFCFDACQEGWVFIGKRTLLTTTACFEPGGFLVSTAAHDETGKIKVADCNEPSTDHELGKLDRGIYCQLPGPVRYHPYIIQIDVVSPVTLDIDYPVEWPLIRPEFHLFNEHCPSDSIEVTSFDWYGEYPYKKLKLDLGSSMIDGTTYILEGWGCSLNGACMVSWKRFIFDSSVATLLQSYDVRYDDPGVALSWELADNSEIPRFIVSRSEPGEIFIDLPSEEIQSEENRYMYNDNAIEPGKRYVYKVEYISGNSANTLFITEPIETPAALLTMENYPNPFNPSTRIEYTLPGSGAARIAIYDITGKLIRTLFDKFQVAGRHSVIWDGTDESGHGVSSGVYFCRIDALKETLSKKVILMR